MTKKIISSIEFTVRKIRGREMLLGAEAAREYTLAHAAKNSLGETLGWYFGVQENGVGDDSRRLDLYFPTAEAALDAARLHTL